MSFWVLIVNDDQTTYTGGEALTDLVLAVFRLNGRLLAAGDHLVSDLGLTSARWQVLGAIALAPSPQPVAWLARSMGLNRQGVQRIVNEMRRITSSSCAPTRTIAAPISLR